MMIRLYKPLLALGTAFTLAAVPSAALANDIDDIVLREMQRAAVPGVAVSVIERGTVRKLHGYGVANLELAAPVRPDTLFKTGALGMQFTAAGILRLAEDGKIGLDDPVSKYLPELPKTWAGVTIRHLLNHTSGVPATPSGEFQKEYTDAELLQIITGQDINFRPGTRWRFSYVDYVVLGYVMKRVTGENFALFLKKRLFEPAGMTGARGIDELAIIPNRATGYEFRDGGLRNAEKISATANSTADGSLYISVLDYVAWAQAMSRKAVLSPASWAEMAKPAVLVNGQQCSYGLGWYQNGGANAASWYHSGMWQGFQTYAVHAPADDLTVVVLANGETADSASMARRIAQAMAGPSGQKAAAPQSDAPAALLRQVGTVLDDLAADRVDRAKYVDYAKLDLTEMVAQYAMLIAPMGKRQEVALFDTRKECGGTTHRLRARFERGVIDIVMATDADGRIGSLDIVPISAWEAPL
ncbi:CubicO group peptidase (beta-lactamase class C family) [Novosphingobium hassiacum]|uniref:CubicO group peptidase (Beta-lactamase class C family) n=1 Tax=Novosphingobium hassiacum TaxID=173676 RepID=A0A7W5ZWY9_9SPHN|nr:serine hydrolase domain-containing protein [Novosphingobium hassiacum]MBB3859350.1 CubicO group peptidase (beta-lactamase class C family) [Novosphingobium hassiacum]